MNSRITYLISILAMMCVYGVLAGQGIKDSVVHIRTVYIEEAPIQHRMTEGDKNDMKSDADYQPGKRVSDVLGENTSVFIKNYGVGQLSSISINGSSAAQTAILWNGIKINSPSTGQVDLALFDMGTVDNISVTNTASNQFIGGALALNNTRLFTRDTLISNNVIRCGSFNTVNLSSNNIYSAGIFSGSTKVNYLSSANDFPFINTAQIGAPVQKEINAATALLSFMQQIDLRLRQYNIGAMFWVTDADRQLPPIMSGADDFEREWDKSYRCLAYFRGYSGPVQFSFKTAYLYDWLRYTDPNTNSLSSAQASRNLFNMIYRYRQKLVVDGTLHYDHEAAVSSGFDFAHARDIYGVNMQAYYRFWGISKVGISAMQEMLDGRPLPFAPGAFLTLGKALRKSIMSASLNGARAYRLPALNDLYWNPGGNMNLQPEHAWNSSLVLEYSYRQLIKLNLNGFYNYVTDYILWTPMQNDIWTAQNVKRVLSRGLNFSIKAQNKPSLADKGFVVAFYAGYSYTNTISPDAQSADDASKDKQLIYVPLHNFNASLRLQYRRFYICSIHSFTSVRYTATDDSEFLPGYYLSHLEAGKDFYFNNQQIGLSFRVNNLTNCQYQVIEERPMPGRNYEFTARLNLSK